MLSAVTPEIPMPPPMAYFDRIGTHITQREWDEMPVEWKLLPENWLLAFDLAALMKQGLDHPARPILEGLANEGEIVGLHSPPESFKTIFCLQLMKALVTGTHFLGTWKPHRKYRVFFFETEMSGSALAERARRMFADVKTPGEMYFASEADLRTFKRASTLEAKFEVLKELLKGARADVLIIDTANPFFRGKESPNDELNAGKFFDLLESMPVKLKLFVRHEHKPRELDTPNDPDPSMIRGSGQFADVPDLLMSIRRKTKRTHEAAMYITKFRHGSKPDKLEVWFDAGDFKLVPYPPVIHLLNGSPMTRDELITTLKTRFDVGATKADTELIAPLRAANYLTEYQNGHRKVFALNGPACETADWYPVFRNETKPLGIRREF